jgi:hypothetical protein
VTSPSPSVLACYENCLCSPDNQAGPRISIHDICLPAKRQWGSPAQARCPLGCSFFPSKQIAGQTTALLCPISI